MKIEVERRLLQGIVLLGAFVPVVAGGWGVLGGLQVASAGGESQARYLSGLLLGIGLAFWASIRSIERRGPAFRLLGALVAVGGLSRLVGAFPTHFGPPVLLPLVMELGVTPMIVLWRERIERRTRAPFK